MQAKSNLAFAPSAPPLAGRTPMLAKLEAVLTRFEITIADANELVVLQDYEIVIIADDSGSMSRSAQPPHQRQLGKPVKSRWDELCETISEIVGIATCFDESGVDVYFLNRQPLLGVKSATDVSFRRAFQTPPRGNTPLTETLQRVAQKCGDEQQTLLFIMTDGEPNGGKDSFIRMVRDTVSRQRLRIQIMACTSEESEIGWLNALDHDLKEVDVTDDYYSEKAEVIQAGQVSQFTRGDWCMKAMLGPVSAKFDAWDERRGHQLELTPLCECVIS